MYKNYASKTFKTQTADGRTRTKAAADLAAIRSLVLDSIDECAMKGALSRGEQESVNTDGLGRIRIDLATSWSVEVTIYITNSATWCGGQPINALCEDGAAREIYTAKYEAEFSWSATTRSIPNAAASVNLYTKAITLAEIILAKLADIEYITAD